MTSGAKRAFGELGLLWLLMGLLALLVASEAIAAPRAKLSKDVAEAVASGAGRDVILQGDRATVEAVAARHGVAVAKWLKTGAVLRASGAQLQALAADGNVGHLSGDTLVRSMMAVADQAIGADQAWAGSLPGVGSVTGRGIGVALIDSGISNHKALSGRILASVDFTKSNGTGEDALGHGTHIAGIVGGDSAGFKGVAPGAWLVSLKVLGADGSGLSSDVIRAIDFAIEHKAKFGLRVINLSLGRPVFESYADDPLCQAVERAYRAGLVVVASAGNYGKTEDGRLVLGGITSPGNSPYALTVGAIDGNGTAKRSDDGIADFSSRGPTLFDRLVKPDLAAPGRRLHSLYAPGSTLAKRFPEKLISGNGQSGVFELSGTSMSAAVVSGAAALVLEANPKLSPLQVRIALQMSSTFMKEAGLTAAGAGSLNAAAAVQLAKSGPAQIVTQVAAEGIVNSGVATVSLGSDFATLVLANALVWGSSESLVWGGSLVWGNADSLVWGNADSLVWGSADSLVWGSADSLVWGSADSLVWGSADSLVWGSADSLVWGNADSLVWGNADSLVWGNADSLVWGNADSLVWGNADSLVWGN
jgi:serine protease AprX